MSIASNLKQIRATTTITHLGIFNSIVHFGSINTFLRRNKINLPHKSNKTIVTWFHISPGDQRVKLIPEALKHVHLWHTSCNLTKNKMIKLGIPVDKIVVIPLGVNLRYFSPPTPAEKRRIREQLKIPVARLRKEL